MAMAMLSNIFRVPPFGAPLRAVILSLTLAPYLYYAAKDGIFHFVGRKVSIVEHVLHLVIGILLTAAIACAFRGLAVRFMIGIASFLVAGGIDEFIYHRNLPGAESDLHAKEHLSLMIFIVATLGTIWLQGKMAVGS